MAEKYSGGYILLCTERQSGAVIVVFPTSVRQVYFVCVRHLCDGGQVIFNDSMLKSFEDHL